MEKQKKKMEDQGIQKIPLWDKIFSKIAKYKNSCGKNGCTEKIKQN